ncbi:MAG: alpha-L-fucosidase [Sedimentisphaerales bacterium]|nr:alpha-L-fucosidase [Sedimentisphaerales bacterium]
MENQPILGKIPVIVIVTVIFSFLGMVAQGGVKNKYDTKYFERTWESLQQYECPAWFRDAKFGIYAHWGPYSIPSSPTTTDWYSHYMYQPGHPVHKFHVRTYGSVSKFGYKDLVLQFTASNFDADAWAELYAQSGARFAGPVAEHADGFALWDSALTEWDSMDKGPKRDIVAELEKAIRKRGLRFLTSFHHHWKWGWYATEIKNADCLNPRFSGLYGPPLPAGAWAGKNEQGFWDPMAITITPDTIFCTEWLAKIKEVVDRHHPDILWFDSRMHIIEESCRLDMAAHFYNQAAARNQTVIISYKNEDIAGGAGVLDMERSRISDIHPEPLLTDISIASNSWSYCPKLRYYSTTGLIHDLVDIVSKNGCLLLNIAPHPDGTIPKEQIERLQDIGSWLRLNGQAIYDTRPWKVFGEGPAKTPTGNLADLQFEGFTTNDIRFTQAQDGSSLYTIIFGWPQNGLLKVRSLNYANGKITDVRLLNNSEKLNWIQSHDGLKVELPQKAPGKHAFVLRITGTGLTQSN